MVDGTDPSSLPPPPFWRTRYFAFTVMARPERRYLDPLEIKAVIAAPAKKLREPSGRVRYWGWVERLGGYLRVVTLDDGETVHNAFLDLDFLP